MSRSADNQKKIFGTRLMTKKGKNRKKKLEKEKKFKDKKWVHGFMSLKVKILFQIYSYYTSIDRS